MWVSPRQLAGPWTRATDAAPFSPRYLASMTSDSTGAVYVAGGILALGGNVRPTANDVWMSVDGGVTWTSQFAGGTAPGQRGVSLLVSGAPSQLLWMTGVDTGVNPSVYYPDSWASSDSGKTWGRATGAASFGPRDDANGEVFGNGMLVVTGGYTSGGGGLPAQILNDGQLNVAVGAHESGGRCGREGRCLHAVSCCV